MPSPADPPFVLRLPSDLRLLGLARHFVESVCHNLGMDECFSEALQLATHEALQNIIRHAYANRADASIEIQIEPYDGGIEIRVLDEGAPFDVSAVPHLEPGELRMGGRGVFLMRRLLDELQSCPLQPNGNMLRMVKLFPATQRRQFA
jgi:anti-sigma regulatory factor (Ser/Thr protein kinase)